MSNIVDRYTLEIRDFGRCWLHKDKPIWVVEYQKTHARERHFQAYKSNHSVPNCRKPWAFNNKRISTGAGFQTLDEALIAGDVA